MGPTWVLSAPNGPHVGPMNLAIWEERPHKSSMKCSFQLFVVAIQWCPNEHGGIWNHWHLGCLLIHLFRHISKKISKFHVTGLCEGNPLVTDEFPSQRASNLKCFHLMMSSWTLFVFIDLSYFFSSRGTNVPCWLWEVLYQSLTNRCLDEISSITFTESVINPRSFLSFWVTFGNTSVC